MPSSDLHAEALAGIVRGILFSAFQRREQEEDGLSVSWLEYFARDRASQIAGAVHAIRASDLKPGAKTGFAIGNVEVSPKPSPVRLPRGS